MKKHLGYYLKKAEREGWAMGQFNVSNLETLKAIFQAAQKLKSPVIIGTSEGESRFLGLDQAVALVRSLREKSLFPLFLNLDHGHSFSYLKEAIKAGYDAVHFDGSELSLDENIKQTIKVVKEARKWNVLVEGEVGIIGSVLGQEREVLTNPLDAFRFLKETRIDSLAISINNLHGIRRSGVNPNLNIKRLKEIKKIIKKTPLVLHGGSGTPKNDIKKAIRYGISKINFNTELRMSFTSALKKVIKEKPNEIVPYKYMPFVINTVQKVVEEKIKLFGSANKV